MANSVLVLIPILAIMQVALHDCLHYASHVTVSCRAVLLMSCSRCSDSRAWI